MAMDPQHGCRDSMKSLVVFIPLSLAATPSCAPPSDPMADTELGVTQHRRSAQAASPFTLFASRQVRPLALSPDRRHLCAIETPAHLHDSFRVNPDQLIHTASIPVSLEPISVAPRTNRETWVVNHLSANLSAVELDRDVTTGHVERTPVTGDEPRDIVLAGPERRQAFIPRARRGQNIPAGNRSRGSWVHLGQCGRGKVNALIGCA